MQDSDLPDMVDFDYANKCPAPTIDVKDEADPTLILTLDPKKGAENVRDMAQHLVDEFPIAEIHFDGVDVQSMINSFSTWSFFG